MRKGQAAMEFLMTYGWAILVVLIAIGALAYFGVLNPSRFLPNSCTLFPGLACTEFKVEGTANKVSLLVRNGIGDGITVSGLKFKSGAVDLCSGSSYTATITDGGTGWLNGTTCGLTAGSVGSRFKADIEIVYTLAGGGLTHTRTGAMVAQVET